MTHPYNFNLAMTKPIDDQIRRRSHTKDAERFIQASTDPGKIDQSKRRGLYRSHNSSGSDGVLVGQKGVDTNNVTQRCLGPDQSGHRASCLAIIASSSAMTISCGTVRPASRSSMPSCTNARNTASRLAASVTAMATNRDRLRPPADATRSTRSIVSLSSRVVTTMLLSIHSMYTYDAARQPRTCPVPRASHL